MVIKGNPKFQQHWQKSQVKWEIYNATNMNKGWGRGHLPKHFSTEDVRADTRNFMPVDPPGKYEKA